MRSALLLSLALFAGCAERNEAETHKVASLDALVAKSAAKDPAATPAPAPALAPAAHAAEGPAPLDALTMLSAGNARFATNQRTRSTVTSDDGDERTTTAKGQHPFASILTCADSRLSPELIFDQSIGDLFVVRNAGNIAEPIGEGSLEYGVEHLGTRLVVVMGHASCGAVKAVSGSEGPLPGHLADIQQAMPGLRDFAVERTNAGLNPAAVISAAVAHNATAQAAALLASSEILRKAVSEGRIAIVPAIYDLASGVVGFLPPVTVAGQTPAADASAHHVH